ncbi:amidohydrolase family protein [Paenibacillus sp.]
MKLDAHQHFWEYNVAEYGWIGEEMKTIRQSFLPEDLEPLLVQSGLDGCIAVQARQSLTETEWLLQLADRHECIKGVVGWVDLCSDEVRNQLELFASSPYLKGVRHVVQDEPDLQYALREDFQRGISLLKEFDLAYDLLVSKEELPYAVELVKAFHNHSHSFLICIRSTDDSRWYMCCVLSNIVMGTTYLNWFQEVDNCSDSC